MENIDRELEKLLCYTMEKDFIDVHDVEAITTEQTENKIFDMVDAVAAHQQKKALDLYYDLLALKEAPMRILYLITNQFQRLMVVKAMTNQGFSNRDIAPKAGCPEWAVKKYQSQCRAFHMEQLKKAIADGVEYETAVKTGRMNEMSVRPIPFANGIKLTFSFTLEGIPSIITMGNNVTLINTIK